MIRYHGGPITPTEIAKIVWKNRNAFISFSTPYQVGLAAKVCRSYALDNGAFPAWTAGKPITDWSPYREWAQEWGAHPGCDFAIIPDAIDGDEKANDDLLSWWTSQKMPCPGAPVWHLHESLDRLRMLCEEFDRVALGSSGLWRQPDTTAWWERMDAVMVELCDPETRRPPCKLHGLRMMANTIVSRLPLASVDSTNIARNHVRWAVNNGMTPLQGAHAMPDFIEDHEVANRWAPVSPPTFFNMDMAG